MHFLFQKPIMNLISNLHRCLANSELLADKRRKTKTKAFHLKSIASSHVFFLWLIKCVTEGVLCIQERPGSQITYLCKIAPLWRQFPLIDVRYSSRGVSSDPAGSTCFVVCTAICFFLINFLMSNYFLRSDLGAVTDMLPVSRL